jgi:exopolysaccharide biosynthesis polyprenyl glycosylphosphotransferase
VVPDFLSQVRLRGGITEFDGLPLFSLQASPMAGWNRLAKRGMDLLLAGAALLLLLPLLGLIVAAIRLTSRGPVLYRQERMGLDGRRFQILKFRSMVPESEPDGARFAADADPRVTTLGRILRKASLDELPQLLNVLRGEMSLVGPRPERPVFIQDFRGHFPRYMLRHRVKSGMTGLAQVYGWRGNTSVKKRLEHDLFYIEHWSLWLDMKILWMTIPAVLRGKGAL